MKVMCTLRFIVLLHSIQFQLHLIFTLATTDQSIPVANILFQSLERFLPPSFPGLKSVPLYMFLNSSRLYGIVVIHSELCT